MQRPWSWPWPGLLEKEQSGLCGCSRVKWRKGVCENREGTGAGHPGPMGHGENLGLYPKGDGSPGGLWAGGGMKET